MSRVHDALRRAESVGSPAEPPLAAVEDIFGLTKLGQAKTVSATFGKDVFTKAG